VMVKQVDVNMTLPTARAIASKFSQSAGYHLSQISFDTGYWGWGSGDQTLRVWDVDTRTCVATLKGHINGVKSLAVMGGCGIGAGALVVSGSWVKPCKKT